MAGTSRSIAVTAFGNLVPPVVALATQPILAHSLGVTGRGEVAAATAPLLLATALLTVGLPESLTYHFASGYRRLSRSTAFAVGALALLGIAGSGAVSLLAGPLSAGNSDVAMLIQVTGLAIAPGIVIAALRGVAAGAQLWTLVAVERIANAVIRFTAIAFMAAYGILTPLTASLTLAITTFIAGSIYVVVVFSLRRHDLASADGPSPALFKYGYQVWLGTATGMLLSRVDQLLMTPLSSVEALGYYAVAVSISEVVLVFNSAVRDVMFSLEAKSPDAERIFKASRLSTLFTFVAAALIGLFSPWAIPAFFGEAFQPAVPVTMLLLLAILLGNPGSVAGAALSGRGRPGLRSLSITIAAVLNVAAVFLLVPGYGAMGAASATLIGNIIAGTLNIIWLRVFFGFPLSRFYAYTIKDVRDGMSLLGKLFKFRR